MRIVQFSRMYHVHYPQKKKDVDMLNGNVFVKMLVYTIPLMLSGILQLLFNTADVIVVGKFAADGTTALAAVGSTGSLTNLIIGFFLGLSVGTCVVLSRKLGQNDGAGASDVVHTAILTGLIFGLFLAVVGISFAPIFLRWMNTPENVLKWSALYMRIYFIGLPMSMLYNFGSAVMRAKGDTQYALTVLVVAGITNVILNLITVIGFHMDVAGVAIATVASQTVSAAMVLVHLAKMDDCCRFIPRKLRLDKKTFVMIARIGIPAGLQSVMFSLSNVILQSAVNSLGDVAMAGNTAAGNIDGYIYTACNSVYHASLAFTGQNLGAGKVKRIKKVCISGMSLVTMIGLVLGVTAILLRIPLLNLYVGAGVENREAIIENGELRLYITALTYFLCGLMEVASGLLRGLGDSVTPMIISLIGSCVFRIMWVEFAFRRISDLHNLFGLFISYPVSWLLTSAAEFIAFFIVYHRIWRNHKKSTSANLANE